MRICECVCVLKVYVASSFKLIKKVETVVSALERAGHEITVKWWAREYVIDGEIVHTQVLKKRNDVLSRDEFYSKPETLRSFAADVYGVKSADVFVFVAADEPRKFTGANVELGIAIGDKIPCYALGSLELSVLYYPVCHCGSIGALLRALAKYERFKDCTTNTR